MCISYDFSDCRRELSRSRLNGFPQTRPSTSNREAKGRFRSARNTQGLVICRELCLQIALSDRVFYTRASAGAGTDITAPVPMAGRLPLCHHKTNKLAMKVVE